MQDFEAEPWSNTGEFVIFFGVTPDLLRGNSNKVPIKSY